MEQGQRKKGSAPREYRTDEIVVYWEPRYCIHTGNCSRLLPEVFDGTRRPWVVLDSASAEEIASVIMTCPTGALGFQRLDGGEQEPAEEPSTLQPRLNGPLFVRGRIRIVDRQGEVVRETSRAALCRCGQSSNKPFCDGSHRASGFQAG